MPKECIPGNKGILWEIREDKPRSARQIVVTMSESVEAALPMEARFLEAYLERITGTGPEWILEARVLDKPDRFGLFLKASDYAIELSCIPIRISYSLFSYREGTLFSILMKAEAPGLKTFRADYPVDPSTEDVGIRSGLEKVLLSPSVCLTILDGELVPVMAREVRQGVEAAAAAMRLWRQAHDRAIGQPHVFAKTLERFYKENHVYKPIPPA